MKKVKSILLGTYADNFYQFNFKKNRWEKIDNEQQKVSNEYVVLSQKNVLVSVIAPCYDEDGNKFSPQKYDFIEVD